MSAPAVPQAIHAQLDMVLVCFSFAKYSKNGSDDDDDDEDFLYKV